MEKANENKKFYGKSVETIVKFIKTDGIEKGVEFGGYLNCSAVLVTAGGEELTEFQKELIASGDMEAPEPSGYSDSDVVIGVGCKAEKLKSAILEFKKRIDKKQFEDCYAYVSGTPSVSEYKDGRKFVNLGASIIVDLRGKDVASHVKRLQKTGGLWDGIIRPKETAPTTTSETYANAWD